LRGDVTLAQARSRLLGDLGNTVTALVDVDALLLVPQGFEEGFRQPAVAATTERFESFIFSQIEAGATLEEASSNLQLVALFGGDITGVTALGESVFGVELATNEPLTGGSRIYRGVQGGSQIVLIVAGPQAVRQARARTAAARVGTVAQRVLATQASVGVASPEGIPLRVLNAGFTPKPQVAQAVLQQVTTQVNAGLAADLSQARRVLRPRELAAAQARPDVGRLFYGKAVERLVAERIFQDPLHSTILDPAGIGRRGPDVLGIGPARGLRFDITTSSPRAIAAHLARPYSQNLIIITYDRPATFTVFPP
jgi:hypothetical protein